MKAFLFSLSFFLNVWAGAQKVNLSASVDKASIFIGEQLQLTLKAAFPKEQTVEWLTVDSLLHFEVLSLAKPDSQLSGNDLIITQVVTLTSWDSGRWQIPSFSMAGSNKTAPLPINVTFSAFNPAQDYHDVKDILEVQKPEASKWHWYVIGAILLILLFVLLFPARKKKHPDAKPVTDETIFKKSLTSIEALQKNPPTDAKLLYTELISIFRDYLAKRKNIQSHSKTTDDLSIQIAALQLPIEMYQPLVQTLRLSDLVKFAQFKPGKNEELDSIETIKQSIITIEGLK